MKKVWKYLNITGEPIKAILSFCSGAFILFYGAYIIGQHQLISISALILVPIIAYISVDDVYNHKTAEAFHHTFTLITFIAAFFVLATYSKSEVYLEKKFLQGRVHYETRYGTDEDGRETESREPVFTPLNKTDEWIDNIIGWGLIILMIGSPVGTYYFTKKILEKHPKTYTDY